MQSSLASWLCLLISSRSLRRNASAIKTRITWWKVIGISSRRKSRNRISISRPTRAGISIKWHSVWLRVWWHSSHPSRVFGLNWYSVLRYIGIFFFLHIWFHIHLILLNLCKLMSNLLFEFFHLHLKPLLYFLVNYPFYIFSCVIREIIQVSDLLPVGWLIASLSSYVNVAELLLFVGLSIIVLFEHWVILSCFINYLWLL